VLSADPSKTVIDEDDKSGKTSEGRRNLALFFENNLS